MALFQWSEDMSVDNITIDQQHKTLISMVNAAHLAVDCGRSDEAFENILLKLAQYTQEHFAEEERYMLQIGYPQLDEHRECHQHLLEKVELVKQKISNCETFSPVSLTCFLKDWLLTHIIEEDKSFAVHAKARVS